MKKIFFLALAILAGASMATVDAQVSKEYKKEQEAYRKQAEKTAKKQAKELVKKQKWEYSGVLPLEDALTNFYLQTTDFGGQMKGIEHEIEEKTVAGAEKALLLNAQALYAQEVQAMLGADLANSSNVGNGQAFEEYVARVAAKVKHEFQGDVRRAILLKKRSRDGKSWTVRGFFLIDENAGHLRSRRIADEIERNNGMIDSIHDKVFDDQTEK